MHYGARWYSPEIGRFLQPDTVVPDLTNPQDFRRYTYVRNNHLVNTDPNGDVVVGPSVPIGMNVGDRRDGYQEDHHGIIYEGFYTYIGMSLLGEQVFA